MAQGDKEKDKKKDHTGDFLEQAGKDARNFNSIITMMFLGFLLFILYSCVQIFNIE